MADFKWPKFCTKCGRSIRAQSWQNLPAVGEMGRAPNTIELKNCPCGSTLAIPTEAAQNIGK